MQQILNRTVLVRVQSGKQHHYDFYEQGIYFRTWILTIVRGTGMWRPAVRRRDCAEWRRARTNWNKPAPLWSPFTGLCHRKKVLWKEMAGISLLTQIPQKLRFGLTFHQNQLWKGILGNMVSSLTGFMIETQTHRCISVHFCNCSKFRMYPFKLVLCQPIPKHIMGIFIVCKRFYSWFSVWIGGIWRSIPSRKIFSYFFLIKG